MNLTKNKRSKLYAKYDGKCAYCGCDLPPKWHADHIEPIYRGMKFYDKEKHEIVSGSRLDLDKIENLNPACPSCNNYKHTLSLEEFRFQLSRQVERCMNNCNFKLALRYNQITIHQSPIIFYFESLNQQLREGDSYG